MPARLVATVLLLACALAFPPSASFAHSDLRVSVRARTLELSEGQTAVVRGRVTGSRTGTRVWLLRREHETWTTVGRTRTAARHAFTFRFRALAGVHRYRVVKPRQFGLSRAVSPTVTVTATWRPTIDIASRAVAPDGSYVTRVEGTASRLGGSELVVQRLIGDDWVTTDDRVRVGADGTFGRDFADLHRTDTYRLLAPAAGTRLEATSAPFVTVWTPVITAGTFGVMQPEDTWVVCQYGTSMHLADEQLLVDQFVEGEWTEVGATQVSGSGKYQECFDPVLGAQFRLRAEEAGSRMEVTTPVVTVAEVTWRPEVLEAHVVPVHQVTDGADGPEAYQDLRVTGRTDAPHAEVVLTVDGKYGPLVMGGGHADEFGEFDFRAATAPEGAPVTVRISPSGPMLGAAYEPVPAPLEPWPVALDGPLLRLDGVGNGVGARLEFEAGAAQFFTLHTPQLYLPDSDPVGYKLLDPDGQLVPEDVRDYGGSRVLRSYTTKQAGPYTLVLSSLAKEHDSYDRGGDVAVWLSTPVQYDGGALYSASQVYSQRPNQAVEVTYTGSAGQVLSIANLDHKVGRCGYDVGPDIDVVQAGVVVPRREAVDPWHVGLLQTVLGAAGGRALQGADHALR